MTWQEAWAEGRTPWDAGASAPTLVRLAEAGALPRGRALVPGCGSGYDLLTLAGAGLRALGVDLSDVARVRFEALREAAGVAPERARVEVADFFDPDAVAGPFDLVYDYTFLCAIAPERRRDWAARVAELLAPDGELLTLIFPVADAPVNPGRPPHPMSPKLVRDLLAPHGFEAWVLEPVAESHPSRRGREWLGRWRKARG